MKNIDSNLLSSHLADKILDKVIRRPAVITTNTINFDISLKKEETQRHLETTTINNPIIHAM